jgi:glutamine synthetase
MTNTPQSADDLLARLEADRIEQLWVVYHDYNGRAGAKTIPKASFRSAVHDGVVFAMANLDFDLRDHQVAGATLLADSGDFLAVPDPRSYARLPQYPGVARMHAWMHTPTGALWDGCPRGRLDHQVAQLAAASFSIQAALEPEFYLLTADSSGDYHPVNTTQMFSEAGLAEETHFTRRLLEILDAMGIVVPQFGKEYSPGQYEISTRHGPPIQAIDSYYAVREAVRDAARESGYLATFMPKPYADWSGNSLHVHLSLWDTDGQTDLTPSTADTTSISEQGRWFMGGILAHVAALTGLGSPTVNSYKRLQPGTWAPANTYWGYGNRSGVIRIPGAGKRRHIEYRASDNSCQPALFLTGLLAAGLDGLNHQLDPGPPFTADIGHLSQEEITSSGVTYLPRSLPDALAALESDPVIAAAIGPNALTHFLLVKRHELAQYNLHVHPWERETYLT